ncbi:hypothetical protein JYT86_00465 [bacterium AH-315-N03]|nr:hypothetical protein [bacterium AH-315-N03]
MILSGTEHASDHNTPLLLPRGSHRVVPIVDDFSRDEAGARSVRLEALQSSIVSQNRLSHVLLADPVFRRRVHARTAALVSRFDFAVLHRRYLAAARALGPDLEHVRADGVPITPWWKGSESA